MQTSGLAVDFYDDEGFVQLKEIYPSVSDLPVQVKTAAALLPDDLTALPDDAFALVLHEDDVVLRKFACFDGGNTALSVAYFLRNAYKLPDEAQKVAASNLVTASGWYGLTVPEELSKIASGAFVKVGGLGSWAANRAVGHAVQNPVGTAMTAITAPSILKGVRNQVGENRAAVRAYQQATGESVVTPEQMKEVRGEVTGTPVMPLSVVADRPTDKSLATIKKTGKASEPGKLEINKAVKGKSPEAAPKFDPHIDVTGKTASGLLLTPFVHRFALNGRYPLDSYEHVKKACAYFDEHGQSFSPSERREYCSNLVKRASELNIETSQQVRKYGGEGYAPPDEIDVALDMRRRVIEEPQLRLLLDKIAQVKEEIPPLAFAEVLEEFDKVAHIDTLWDQEVFDPYFSTFGVATKTAAEEYSDFADVVGNYRVTGNQLKDAAHTKHEHLKSYFGEDFCDEFMKDPIGIYKSLPREQKILVINMVTDNAPGVRGSPE